MRRGVTCFVVFKEKSLASALPPRLFKESASPRTRRENFFSKTKTGKREKKEKNVLFNILGWLLLCSIIRLSAFPFVSNDPTLLLLLVVLFIAPSPPPPCISSSSSSSRWDSSTNRSMSRVGIDVFLSLCFRFSSSYFSKRDKRVSERSARRVNRAKRK